MPSKYIALREETSFRTASALASLYYKLLSEDINTTREDFFPETMEYWTTQDKAEGLFRTSGTVEMLMHPLMWPKLLVYFIGDGGSAGAGGSGTGSGSGYIHTWLFGANESVSATGIKPFTVYLGTGLEQDRRIEGCVIESMTIEAVAREPVSISLSILGSGDESLQAAVTPSYTKYTSSAATDAVEQPYLTFGSAQTMTVGNTDRLATAPTIEAYRLTLARGYDADHYVLGTRFWFDATLSGMAEVSGTMDFTFTSQDEHERFLDAVGSGAAGNQTAF
ncbi:MAG: phage tail tube protein, partial [Planctomycetota bacterium]